MKENAPYTAHERRGAGLARRLAHGAQQVLNPVFRRVAGHQRRPAFFDPAATVAELGAVEAAAPAIRAELAPLLPQLDRVPRLHEIDPAQGHLSGEDDRAWRTLFVHLHRAGDRLPNRNLFPRTVAAIHRIPGVFQAFFSILAPGTSVAPHEGPYLGYLRYHLPLVVPREDPPRLRVRDQDHVWREDIGVLFDDSWVHSVENHAEEPRVVLVIDVARPMPWWAHGLNMAARALLFCPWITRPALAAMPQLPRSATGAAAPRSA